MTVYQWFGAFVVFLVALLLIAAGIVLWVRRRSRHRPRETGWLTDDMVQQILRDGTLHEGSVPDARLDLQEIRREEDRFWSESWDEPDPYFE